MFRTKITVYNVIRENRLVMFISMYHKKGKSYVLFLSDIRHVHTSKGIQNHINIYIVLTLYILNAKLAF